MQKINFSANINAPKEKVWEILWSRDSYKTWTKPFSEESDVKTDNWKEGSKVLFVDGTGNGMVSKVASNKTNEFMSFEHLGMVKDGVEDTQSDAVKGWSGAKENYTLKGENGNTQLSVEIDISEEWKDYMEKAWPLAMEKIKDLSEGKAKTVITINTEVNAPIEKAWNSWTAPEHITQWNQASADWHCPKATNDLRTGGSFSATMAAKDGSFSFDFGGVYDEVVPNKTIRYTMGDGRKAHVEFEEKDGKTKITESFEAEGMHSLDMQRGGWQAILDNFKNYTENL